MYNPLLYFFKIMILFRVGKKYIIYKTFSDASSALIDLAISVGFCLNIAPSTLPLNIREKVAIIEL